jgi:hypothetical protein
MFCINADESDFTFLKYVSNPGNVLARKLTERQNALRFDGTGESRCMRTR